MFGAKFLYCCISNGCQNCPRMQNAVLKKYSYTLSRISDSVLFNVHHIARELTSTPKMDMTPVSQNIVTSHTLITISASQFLTTKILIPSDDKKVLFLILDF